MSKGEKKVWSTIVVGLGRIVQPFRVAINAKGGYCWHVYRNSVFVIDSKNNNNDGILAAMMSNMKAVMIASGIVVYKLRRTST
jgi:DNA-binding beta-propeller fold protein YncE